jgi:hypothetical protein
VDECPMIFCNLMRKIKAESSNYVLVIDSISEQMGEQI